MWVQRRVSLVDDSNDVWVGGWLAGCVLVRVEERVAENVYLLMGYTLDY